MRHVGYIVQNMDREIDWLQRLGYKVKIHRMEEWAHRRLEVVKMEREGDPTMIELVHVRIGEWEPHIAIDVEKWPHSPIVTRELGEAHDDEVEVRFAVSPNKQVFELVKRTTAKEGT